MTRPRLRSIAIAIGLAGTVTVGAALLPARGVQPLPPLAPSTGDISFAIAADGVEPQIEALQRRLAREPNDARSAGALALLLIEHARQTADPTYYAQAADAIAASFAAQPNANDVALAAEAALLSAQHRFTEALTTAERALRLDPYSVAALGVRVDALTELGHLTRALRAARQFDARQPGLAATTRLAYQAELRGNDQEAVRFFRAARIDTSEPAARAFVEYHLGELARRAGRLGVADGHYRNALDAAPGDPAATAGRAKVLALRGQKPRAIAVLSDLVATVPLPEHLIGLGELHLLQGDREAAEAQFAVVRASADLARTSGVRPDLELAWFEADHGDPRRALQLARAEWSKRHAPMAADALAWALHVNGRDALALRYSRLATAYGGDARALHHRGVIEATLGMARAAAEHLRAALALDRGYAVWHQVKLRSVLKGLAER